MQKFFGSLKVDITANFGPDNFLGKKGRIKSIFHITFNI